MKTILEAGHATIHRSYSPSTEDLHTCMDIAESIVASIYIHPEKANKLKGKDENTLMSELQKYFVKYGIKATDWDIDFIGNDKLSNTNILKSLKKGQSKYSLIITGQIYHHSGKGNKKSNLLTELKQPRYIDHIVGCNPQHLLTTENLLDKLEQYFRSS